MPRFPIAAFPLMGINAMLGVGLFLPMVALLEGRGSLSPLELGILAGAFPVTEGIAGLLYPRLLSKLPARFLMVSGQVLCASSCIALLSGDVFWILLLGRIVGGWGGASVSIAQYLIGKGSSGSDRVRQLGELGAAQAFGFIFGLALMGLTIALAGPMLGMQLAVGVGVLSGLAAAVLVWRADLPVVVVTASQSYERQTGLPLGELALYGLNTFVYIGLAVQMSIWAGRQPELGPVGTSATFVVLATLSMAFQAKVAAWAVERFGHGRTIAAGFLVTGLGAAVFATGAGLAVGVIGLAISRIGYAVIVPATLARILGDARARASEYRAGWAMFAASLGSGFGPMIVGAVHDRYSIGIATAVLAAVAFAVGSLLVLRTTTART